MKHIFIVNPVAAHGKSLKIAKNIEKVCEDKKIDYIMEYTTIEKNAASIAQKYKDEENIIFSVGGDGNLTQVLDGIVGTKNLLGVVPAGSGNDFSRTLKTIDEETFSMDIGKINDRYFLNVACIGIDAEVGNNVEIIRKTKIPTSQIYNASIIYTFIKFKFKDIKFRMNNKEKEGNFSTISVCNGRYYGRGFNIAPHADIRDGLFDIYFAEKLSRIKILLLMLKMKQGKHENSKYLHKDQTNEIVITTNEKIRVNMDGEILENTRFEIKLIKDGVKIYNNQKLVEEFLDCK